MRSPRLESLFPNLRADPYAVTSPASTVYNCIAWAAGDNTRWWEPDPSAEWTSKCGGLEDIVHSLASLEGARYGTVAQILKRAISPESHDTAAPSTTDAPHQEKSAPAPKEDDAPTH
jgi:hypothetical protein